MPNQAQRLPTRLYCHGIAVSDIMKKVALAIIFMMVMITVNAENIMAFKTPNSGQIIQINYGNSNWEIKAVKEFRFCLEANDFTPTPLTIKERWEDHVIISPIEPDKTITFGPNPISKKGKYVTIKSDESTYYIKFKDFNFEFTLLALK